MARGASLDAAVLHGQVPVLRRDGFEGTVAAAATFGASTAWMGRLLARFDAGRDRGCSVLAIGFTPASVPG